MYLVNSVPLDDIYAGKWKDIISQCLCWKMEGYHFPVFMLENGLMSFSSGDFSLRFEMTMMKIILLITHHPSPITHHP